jgi:hypothetical protein
VTQVGEQHFDASERLWRDCVAAATQRALDFHGEAMAPTIHRAQSIALEHGVWPDPSGIGGRVRSQADPRRAYHVTTDCPCEASTFAADQPASCKHQVALLIHRKAQQLQREFAPKRQLPEAPVSLNTHVSIEGRQVQLTLRGFSAGTVLDGFASLMRQLEGSASAAPTPLPETPPPPAPRVPSTPPLCPRHKRAMKPSKFDGGGFYCAARESDSSYCREKI